MPQPFYILFGFAFTVAVAWSLGRMLFRRLGASFYRLEEDALAFVAGSALLSLAAFLLCSVGLARKGVLLAVGAAIVAEAIHRRALNRSGKRFAALSGRWKVLLAAAGGLFSLLYLVNAMAPEYSPDGSAYHLGLVARYLRAHGFVAITTNIYANLSQGVEMLFLWAFAFGRHSAAAMVHLAFLAALPVLILSYGRRQGHPAAGAAAALFVYLSPVMGVDGTVAYNDAAVAAVVFAVFHLLQIWDQERNNRLLAAVGLLAGFAFAIKYTAFPAVIYAAGFVLWKERRWKVLRPLAAMAACALLMIAPWLVKNVVVTGNPFSPFLNGIFPNPAVHVSFERDYSAQLRTYGLASRKEIPRQILWRGDRLTGLFGPLFLLAPVALIGLRRRPGRRLLFAAGLFALTYPANIGTRFLIPALPFVALSMALAMERWGTLLLLVAALHALASWPPVLSRYCAPTAWRLAAFPVRAALRRIPEEQFLIKHLPEYLIARMIERRTPPQAAVFSFGQVAEAYTTRRIIVNFQGALNERLMRTLWEPMAEDFQPRHRWVFRYRAGAFRKLKIIQTAKVGTDIWAITELRVYNQGVELPRSNWKVTAEPNHWDAGLAMDGSPVTQWRTWDYLKAGQFYQVSFGSATVCDEVRIITSSDHWKAERRLEGEDAAGHNRVLADKATLEIVDPPKDLRRLAGEEVRSHGIDYLLVHQGSFGQQDFRARSGEWGFDYLESTNGADLYQIRKAQ
ncbi:MAG: glycosyltransferase family 39 protein [Bryobacterales bacterium]|nr:glycosyltransferase family 39 protein [Bryobacterales bacterium]